MEIVRGDLEKLWKKTAQLVHVTLSLEKDMPGKHTKPYCVCAKVIYWMNC